MILVTVLLYIDLLTKNIWIWLWWQCCSILICYQKTFGHDFGDSVALYWSVNKKHLDMIMVTVLLYIDLLTKNIKTRLAEFLLIDVSTKNNWTYAGSVALDWSMEKTHFGHILAVLPLTDQWKKHILDIFWQCCPYQRVEGSAILVLRLIREVSVWKTI